MSNDSSGSFKRGNGWIFFSDIWTPINLVKFEKLDNIVLQPIFLSFKEGVRQAPKCALYVKIELSRPNYVVI